MESLSNTGKRCFIHKNNTFRRYCKDQAGTKQAYWRLKTSTVGDVVELISNHAHDNTVQNEAVYMYKFCALLVRERRPVLHLNVRPKLSELFCHSKPDLIISS